MEGKTLVAAYFPWAFLFTFVAYFVGLFVWWAKAHFYNADKTYMKLHTYLKRNGVWGLLVLMQIYGMTSIIIYGCIATYFLLHK